MLYFVPILTLEFYWLAYTNVIWTGWGNVSLPVLISATKHHVYEPHKGKKNDIHLALMK